MRKDIVIAYMEVHGGNDSIDYIIENNFIIFDIIDYFVEMYQIPENLIDFIDYEQMQRCNSIYDIPDGRYLVSIQ